MSSLAQLVRRHPISTFAILACLFGWMVYGLAALHIGSNPENMPLGPAMAALVVTSCQGREALFAWGRTLRRWVASPWLYGVAIGAPIALHVLIVLVNHVFGAPLPTGHQLSAWPEIPVTFVAMLLLVGLGEEAGWTAFAAPVMLRRHGLWGAFALLAPLRIFWHLPLMLTGDMPVMVGLLGNAGFQMIVLQMLRHRRGSWTHAAVWHAMLNAFGGAFFFTMVTGADKERLGTLLALVYVVAALLTLVPALLRRSRRGQEPADTPTTVAPSTIAMAGAGSLASDDITRIRCGAPPGPVLGSLAQERLASSGPACADDEGSATRAWELMSALDSDTPDPGRGVWPTSESSLFFRVTSGGAGALRSGAPLRLSAPAVERTTPCHPPRKAERHDCC